MRIRSITAHLVQGILKFSWNENTILFKNAFVTDKNASISQFNSRMETRLK